MDSGQRVDVEDDIENSQDGNHSQTSSSADDSERNGPGSSAFGTADNGEESEKLEKYGGVVGKSDQDSRGAC